MVFGTQALGVIVGPLVALALLGAGASDNVAWRVMRARRGARRRGDLPSPQDAGIAALPGSGAGTRDGGGKPDLSLH
jgi:hypothetical protein